MFVRISRDLEGSFGTRRIALIYIVSGVSGTLASCLFLPTWIGVGSSGALYGLIGAAMADWVHNKDLYANKYCYCLSLVFSAALGLAMGLLPTVDNFANLGGLLAGFLLGLVILPSKVAVGEYQITGCGIFVIVIGAFGLIAWFGVGFYDLYYHNGIFVHVYPHFINFRSKKLVHFLSLFILPRYSILGLSSYIVLCILFFLLFSILRSSLCK